MKGGGGARRSMYRALHPSCFVVISSAPSPLLFLSRPPASGLCRTQTVGASGLTMLTTFRPPLRLSLGPSFAHRPGVESAASGGSNPLRVLAMSFRRLDRIRAVHQIFNHNLAGSLPTPHPSSSSLLFSTPPESRLYTSKLFSTVNIHFPQQKHRVRT